MLYAKSQLHLWFFSSVWSIYACVLSHVWLFVTPWTVACQAPLSMGVSRQGYWSRLPFPHPGDLPNPGIELMSPMLEGGFFTTEPPGNSHTWWYGRAAVHKEVNCFIFFILWKHLNLDWWLQSPVCNFFFTTLRGGMWDLNYPTRDWIHAPCIERWCFNHWHARKSPVSNFYNRLSMGLLMLAFLCQDQRGLSHISIQTWWLFWGQI